MDLQDICQGARPNLDPTLPLSKDGSITYASGNKLVYAKDNSAEHTSFLFDYVLQDRVLRLNDLLLLPTKWALMPVESRFCTRLVENGRPQEVPEVQLCIPELTKSEMNILSALHEIGHTRYDDELNLQRNQKEGRIFDDYSSTFIDADSRYILQLIRTHNTVAESIGDRQFKKICERNAWAYALKTMRKLNLLPFVEKNKLQDFYRKHLKNYGQDFV